MFLLSGQGFRYLLGLPLYAAMCAAILLAVAASFRLSWRNLRLPRLLAAWLVLAAVGIAWSATRPITTLAVLVMVATTYVALSIVGGMTALRFMESLYRGFQISLAGGVLFELVVTFVIGHPIMHLSGDLARLAPAVEVLPTIHWSEDLLLQGGPIQGFVGNRNPMAAIALIAAIAALVVWSEGRVRRVDAIATLVMAIGVLLLTRSATVTVAALYVGLLILAAFAIRAAPPHLTRRLSIAVLVCTAAGAAITIRFPGLVFGWLGRSPEASNRTTLWHAVIGVAESRPEGWGFVGYWPLWDQPYSGIIAEAGSFAPYAHSVFLDAWLQLGVVGLALLVALVVQLCVGTWRLVKASTKQSSYLPLGWALIAAALVIEAFTESRMLVEGGWFLFVALLVSAREWRASAPPGVRFTP